ncbi:MAG TPA: hypothetical protein GXZ58_06115 [Bacilli bacterium]|nr:hypothetical protein [Bacilli bacterium]
MASSFYSSLYDFFVNYHLIGSYCSVLCIIYHNKGEAQMSFLKTSSYRLSKAETTLMDIGLKEILIDDFGEDIENNPPYSLLIWWIIFMCPVWM